MVVFGQKLKYLIDKNRPKEEHMKINFYYFQIDKWMLQTVGAEKVDGKNGVVFLNPCFLSELRSFNCSKSPFFTVLCRLQQNM